MGTVTGSSYDGVIDAQGSQVGGLVGYDKMGTVTQSTSSGSVS